MEEPDRPQSMGSQRVRCDRVTNTHAFCHQSIPSLAQMLHYSQNDLPKVDHSIFLPLPPPVWPCTGRSFPFWLLSIPSPLPQNSPVYGIGGSQFFTSLCRSLRAVMFPLPWASRAQASLPGTWNLMTKRENSWENSWAVVGWDQWHTEEWSLDGIQSSSYGHSAWPPMVPPLSPFHNFTTCLDVILLNTKLSSLCLSVYYPQNNTVKLYFISHYTAIYPTLLYAKFFFPFLKCSCSQVLLYFAWAWSYRSFFFFKLRYSWYTMLPKFQVYHSDSQFLFYLFLIHNF